MSVSVEPYSGGMEPNSRLAWNFAEELGIRDLCLRLILVAIISIVSAILIPYQSHYDSQITLNLLKASVTALSITVAIVALYHRDFLDEMNTFLTKTGIKTRLAGKQIASEYEGNFAVLAIAEFFLVISISALFVLNFFYDTFIIKAIGLWSFLSGIGSLALFVIALTTRLCLDARFYKTRFT